MEFLRGCTPESKRYDGWWHKKEIYHPNRPENLVWVWYLGLSLIFANL
jgi:hypothetical protein